MDDQQSRRRRSQSVAAMVLGILGILCIWVPFVGCVLALVAVVFAAVALNNAPRTTPDGTRGMAIAGLVLGILGLVAGIPYALGLSCLCAMLPAVTFYW